MRLWCTGLNEIHFGIRVLRRRQRVKLSVRSVRASFMLSHAYLSNSYRPAVVSVLSRPQPDHWFVASQSGSRRHNWLHGRPTRAAKCVCQPKQDTSRKIVAMKAWNWITRCLVFQLKAELKGFTFISSLEDENTRYFKLCEAPNCWYFSVRNNLTLSATLLSLDWLIGYHW